MHGGVGQEELQTNGLRDAACQKGEKTKVFSLDGSQLLDGVYLSVSSAKGSVCVCVECKDQISV